ncbi:tetratricopeptide repeat protein [Streptomyces lavendulae]|uniref:tetratricopeptide repeat protein n=1 Tax=Streptomyces lavendulae TaxID=1914 RepID=UPI0024A23676|nr:hypothetical protein Sros01_71710 [Streptomyces roseochromogenus]
MGALAAARHRFRNALTWARKAVATGPATPASYGVLAGAHTRLGQYQEAEEAVQKAADLRPDSSSLARASVPLQRLGRIGPAATSALVLLVGLGLTARAATGW